MKVIDARYLASLRQFGVSIKSLNLKHMNPVVHFEMPIDDGERAKEFYSKAFGWKLVQLGQDMGDYILAQTDVTDEAGMLAESNRINGGFFKRTVENAHPSVVIAVEDIRASMKKVTDAGGTIVPGDSGGEPVEIPGIGQYVAIEDSEGNRVGMLQPSNKM